MRRCIHKQVHNAEACLPKCTEFIKQGVHAEVARAKAGISLDDFLRLLFDWPEWLPDQPNCLIDSLQSFSGVALLLDWRPCPGQPPRPKGGRSTTTNCLTLAGHASCALASGTYICSFCILSSDTQGKRSTAHVIKGSHPKPYSLSLIRLA